MSKCEHLVGLDHNPILRQSVENGQLVCNSNEFCDWKIPFTFEDIKGQNIACDLLECPKVRPFKKLTKKQKI